MTKQHFIVRKFEVWVTDYLVEAESREHAAGMVCAEGEPGVLHMFETEYSHTSDSEVFGPEPYHLEEAGVEPLPDPEDEDPD